MDGPPTIRPPGITRAGEALRNERAEAVELKLSRATELRHLTDEYEFYTDALLYARVRLCGANPYLDFLNTVGKDVGKISMCFPERIFSGLEIGGDENWNHALLGMPKEHWPAFCSFIGSLAFHDRDLDLLTRVRTQDLRIYDPLYLAKQIRWSTDMPTVGITAFVLDTNRGCTYFERPFETPAVTPLLPGGGSLFAPRVVETCRSYDDTFLFAHSLGKDAPDPYGDIDRHRSKQLGCRVEEAELIEKLKQDAGGDGQDEV